MQSVIFDLDGTLLDSMALWHSAGDVYLKELGIDAADGIAEKIFTLTVRGAAEYIKESYGLALSVDEVVRGINGVMERAYFQTIQPKEGAAGLIRALSARGVKMAIATATDKYLVRAALSRLGLESYFSGIFTCSEVGVSKRDGADVYEAAQRCLGAEREDCWVFEDSPHAARSAAAAGFKVAGVKDVGGGSDQEELKKYCKVYFESFVPVENVLRTIGI